MSDEVFRAVNRYIDYSTGQESLRCTRTYNAPGKARAMATKMRHGGNKSYSVKKIPNRTDNQRNVISYFEFVETWAERASEWERI